MQPSAWMEIWGLGQLVVISSGYQCESKAMETHTLPGISVGEHCHSGILHTTSRKMGDPELTENMFQVPGQMSFIIEMELKEMKEN